MNDMTDSEAIKKARTFLYNLAMGNRGFNDFGTWPLLYDRLESIATKYESMARAVLWAYDKWVSLLKYGGFRPDRMAYGLAVEEATGKHPSDWTREGLMKHLGIAQEESKP